MPAIEILLGAAAVIATFWAAYLLILPVAASAFTRRTRVTPRDGQASVVVIIPAHNMARVIARCIASLREVDYPADKVQLQVVADHCDDDTASIAAAAGASVLVREDGPRGKTYTLAWTLDTLNELGILPDLYVIVDATARVERGFLSALAAKWRQGEHIVVSHPIVDSENRRWFAKCLGVMLAHRNTQNRARERLALSSLIEGRGMGYSQDYIRKFGWSLALPVAASPGSHPTEDWRHGVQAVEQGYRVAFADDAYVLTSLRESLGDATRQGARWEKGRMLNAATLGLKLLRIGIRDRSTVKIFAALDAIQPPVAILGAFSLGLAVAAALLPVTGFAESASMVPVALLGLYAIAALAQARRDGIPVTTALWLPVYLAWRCVSFLLAWSFFERLLTGQRKKANAGQLTG